MEYESFGAKKTEHIYEMYMKKFVWISSASGNESFEGFLNEFRDGHYILNPHVGVDFNEGKRTFKIVNMDQSVAFSIVGSMSKWTEETLKGYCDYRNKLEEKEVKKREVEERELELKIKYMEQKPPATQLELDFKKLKTPANQPAFL